MTQHFDFNDINLIPKKGIVDSRSEINTQVKLGKHLFNLPVVPANMQSVINEELAIKLASEGYFYIMHRFEIDTIGFIKMMNNLNLITSISLGVNEDAYDIIDRIKTSELVVDYITIDIAHGHCLKMEKMLKHIKLYLPETFVIAGNVSTSQAVFDLSQWGSDAVKVGIAPGLSCTTAFMTGFGSRDCQASTIFECARNSDVPIIADGGVRFPADISKAVVMGATMVMCGSLVTGCTDSPGELKEIDGKLVKEYWGSASQYQSGKSNRIEGKMSYVPYKEKTLLEQMEYLKECVQSAISYGGGNYLCSLESVQWKVIK